MLFNYILHLLVGLFILQKSYLEKSLDNYTWLVDYCDRHREDAEKAFAQELPMCKEMVELLPLKIAAVA